MTRNGGNIEKMILEDADHIAFDSIRYSFNTNPNYFKIADPHFFLFDPFFQLHAGVIAHIPYFYSTNNVTQFTIYVNWDYDVTFGLDSVNQVTSVNLDGAEYMKYKYECQ